MGKRNWDAIQIGVIYIGNKIETEKSFPNKWMEDSFFYSLKQIISILIAEHNYKQRVYLLSVTKQIKKTFTKSTIYFIWNHFK